MKEDTTEIKAQTTAIKADTEEIKQDIRQISGLVEEIALLRLQVSQLKQENGSAGVTLQRFLDETSSYAESVVDATDPDQVDLDGMGNLPVIGEEDSDIYEDCSSEVDRPVDGQRVLLHRFRRFKQPRATSRRPQIMSRKRRVIGRGPRY